MSRAELASSVERPCSSDHAPHRSLAIVGGGPRGLYCLESLVRLASQRSSLPRLCVTIFEPSPTVGAGTVYEPTQPHYLRMNFAAKHINAWPPKTSATHENPVPTGPSLLQWLAARNATSTDPNATLPRAVVGEYLHDCFQRVTRSLPAEISLRIERARVNGLQRRGMTWELTTDRQTVHRFDEVLLTVGHQGWRDDRDRIYPVARQLSQQRVPPASTVVVRGFALTWIDATLSLTEGRGGKFHPTPAGFRYERSGTEPDRIVPTSRSFRPLLAKPDDGKTAHLETCRPIWRQHRQWIDSLVRPQGGFDFMVSLWPIVLNAASQALQHLDAADDVEGWMHNWVSGPMSAADAESRMRRSYAVAQGQLRPGPAWALGESWRQLYPSLVNRISHAGLAVESWPAFRAVACELERIAFGPPADNLGRMLALIDAGIVDLSGTYSEEANVCRLNAVLPAPNDSPEHSPLQQLLQQRLVHRMPGGQGIDVDRCGRPLDRDGQAIDGLAILGRPTEGCILGNDTLSRTLHQHPERWAAAVARRLLTSRQDYAQSTRR